MTKSIVFWLLGTFLLTIVSPVDAQQLTKIPRIGFVLGSDGSDPRLEAFRQGLRGLGYNEGKNLLIEYRPAGGNLAHSSSRVAELMQLKVECSLVEIY